MQWFYKYKITSISAIKIGISGCYTSLPYKTSYYLQKTILLVVIIWRPPTLSGLTPIILNTELSYSCQYLCNNQKINNMNCN